MHNVRRVPFLNGSIYHPHIFQNESFSFRCSLSVFRAIGYLTISLLGKLHILPCTKQIDSVGLR